MPFEIIRNDITKMNVEAIVNAANTNLVCGGGVCGAIFNKAGEKLLTKECEEIGFCDVGQAVITSGCNLDAKYIIHTVGPVWEGGSNKEEIKLASCYLNSLNLAKENKIETIAFPLLSSGIYGYPKEQALQVAINAIKEFLLTNDMMIFLVVYDRQSFVLSENKTDSIKRFIDDNYVDIHKINYMRRRINEDICYKEINVDDSEEVVEKMESSLRNINDIVTQLDETFSSMLLRFIDEKEMTDSMVYKKANIDRRMFSKIRCNKHYKPSKKTALAFAIALELSLDETKDFLNKAGYALSHSLLFDVIIEYFIEREEYDVFEINATLFHFEQALLSS